MSSVLSARPAIEAPHPLLAANERRMAPVRNIPVRVIESQVLLDGSRELVIAHQGQSYHLRLTRNDKLILTK